MKRYLFSVEVEHEGMVGVAAEEAIASILRYHWNKDAVVTFIGTEDVASSAADVDLAALNAHLRARLVPGNSE